MLKKIKTKLKNFFSPIFNPKTKETGFFLTSLVIFAIVAVASTIALSMAAQLIGAKIEELLGEIGMGVLKGLVWFFYYISASLVGLTGNILSSVLSSDFIRRSITKESVVVEGWKIVRNLANMFIVLGFVVVGIATILRIREYEAQKTLLPLILIAILINFSAVFCGLIIDASNITMNYFLTGGGGAGGIVTPITESLTSDANRQIEELIDDVDTRFWELIATYVGLTIFNTIAMIVFLILALILLARQAILMCLVILAPLAFFCWIFKATKKIWSKWWENFVKWCFIGVGTIFFVYLAAFIISKGLFVDPGAGGGGGGPVQTLGFLGFLVPIIFLLVGLKITLGSSAMGATAVLGLATGAAGFVAGKMAGGAKALGKTVAESESGRKISSGVGRLMEKTGIRAPGKTAQEEQKRSKEYLDKAEARYATNPDAVIKAAKGRAGKLGAKAEDREASAMVAAKHGKLGTDNASISNYRKAVSSGRYDAQVKEAENKDPRLAQYNDRKINETMKTTGITNKPDAVREAQRDIVKRQSAGELGNNITTDALKDLNTIEDISLERHLRHPKFQENLSPAKIAAMKQFTTAGTDEFKAINKKISDLKATGNPADAVKAADLENKQIEIDRLT